MFARALTAIALLALTTACSSGGGGGAGEAPKRVTPPGTFKPASCKADDKGGIAIYANAGVITHETSEYFGKVYNRPDLEAVYDASMLSTAIYGSQINANIFSVPVADADPDKCYSYSFLPEASEKQQEFWKEAAGTMGGAGTLQGLYFRTNKPYIFILRGTDRWTLVHELMHYNFDATRIALGQDSISDLEARLRAAQRAFDKHMMDYQADKTRRDLGDAAAALETMVRAVYQKNVDSFLEEVAIESLLIERFYEGRLKNVSSQSAESGVWYITQSKENAMVDFKDYLPLLDRIEQLANEHTWPEIAQQMQTNRDLIKAVEARVDGIIAQAKKRLNLPTGEETQPTPLPVPTEGERIVIAASFKRMFAAHTLAYTNTPEYKLNKRGVRRLVEKYK
ncbi:MAG: hypothetical protein V4760_02790 [Bdellovibrionota bacterium]